MQSSGDDPRGNEPAAPTSSRAPSDHTRDIVRELARLRAFVESVDDLLVALDLEGRITWANPAALRAVGMDEAEAVGRSVFDFVADESRAPAQAAFATIKGGTGVPDLEVQVDTATGRATFEIRGGVLYDGRKPVGTIHVAREVSERNRARAALRAGERRYRELADSIPDTFFVLDTDFTVTYWNRASEEAGGMTASEVCGRHLSELDVPCLGSEPQAFLQAVLDFGMPHTRIVECAGPLFFEVTAYPTSDGIAVLSRDVTARRLAEQELRMSRHFLQRILDGTPDLLYIYDLVERRNEFANRGIAEFLGYSADEIRALGPYLFTELLHPDDAETVAEHHAGMVSAPDDEVHTVEFRMKHARGDWRRLRSSDIAFSRGADRHVRQILGSAEDVTEQREAAERIVRLNDELEQRVRERTADLENAVKALESFAYSISHDLRAPLRAIDGYAAMVAEDCAELVSDETRENLARVRHSAQRMGDLIDDLLALARVGRGPKKEEFANLDVLIDEALADLGRLAQIDRVEIRRSRLPQVVGDPQLLQQVWANLLSNALKFSANADHPEIQIGCRRLDGEDVFFVKDNGVGFDMEYADKLFGVFQRLHGAEDYEGTGVGLAIVDRVVRLHGGRVWAESQPGHGATFSFTLSEPRP